ncbi:MAG: LexA family transcriptional regulator [Muribaculaceae bacterium]|nr:LexA family transcriptional regulator [Muribaculaceae bacterium]
MENEKDIINRIKYLIAEMGGRQAQFAKKVDINPSNLSKYLNGRLPVSDALINKIVVNMGVSKQWLETGDDLPFAKQAAPLARTLTIDESAMTRRGHRGTPVYDIDVTAGLLPRASMFADEHIIGTIDLPHLSPDNRIVRVSGDSMEPVIHAGDLVAVRELSSLNTIIWGEIYVVTLDDYRMVKYLRRHTNPSMVILRSENANYDDIDIARNEIRDLMFVQHIIHIATRM